jgi:hypothetical protein
MDKDKILEAVKKMLFEDSSDLSREDYRELLEEIESECRDALNALDADEPEF